jgi:hypothetical protein
MSDSNNAGLNCNKDCFGPVGNFELFGYVVQVVSDCELAYAERIRNFFIGQPFRDEL